MFVPPSVVGSSSKKLFNTVSAATTIIDIHSSHPKPTKHPTLQLSSHRTNLCWLSMQSQPLQLSKRVFHFLQVTQRQLYDEKKKGEASVSPRGRLSAKEFNEAYQFVVKFLSLKKNFPSQYKSQQPITVIDCCGGHGCLAYFFLLLQKTVTKAIVIDPAECKSGRKVLRETFKQFLPEAEGEEHVTFDSGRIEERLALTIEENGGPNNCIVVGLHCCSWLSKEILNIASTQKVGLCAIMPCCQKDFTGGNLKDFSKSSKIPFATMQDVMLAGWLEGRGYQGERESGYRNPHPLLNKTNK